MKVADEVTSPAVGDPDCELAGLLSGGPEGVLTVHDAAADDLYAYAWFLLAPGRHAADDGPAEAVLDALLVAAETVGELVNPGLTRAWLYALTRNECLRVANHRSAGWPSAEVEAAELAGRHELTLAEVATILGRAVRPSGEPEPPVPVMATPEWVRAELAAATGVEAAGRRAELAARAHPYDSEGFPIALDSRRLSARALAWSAAAAVLVALALLATLPGGGGIASSALPGPARAAAVVAPVAGGPEPAPLPTLRATPFGVVASTGAPRPAPAPDRGADRRTTTPAPTPADPDAAAGSRTDGTADDDGGRRIALLVSARRTDDCDGSWTAGIRVWAYGREQGAVARVTVSAPGAGPVVLSGGDGSWSGELGGLPAGQDATLTVTAAAADGSTLRSASRTVDPDC